MSTTASSIAADAFARLLRLHLERGTRPSDEPTSGPWSVQRFGVALDRSAHKIGFRGPTDRTVRNWLAHGNNLPQERYFPLIMDVLFGDDPSLSEYRTQFSELWRRAKGYSVLRPAAASLVGESTFEEHAHSSRQSRWDLVEQENPNLGLAAFFLHRPAPTNEPETFYLQVSLAFDKQEYTIEGTGEVFIGLNAARLVPSYRNCQPLEMPEVQNVVYKGGVFEITGPRDQPGGRLVGMQLTHTTLAVIGRTSEQPAEIKLALQCRRRDVALVTGNTRKNPTFRERLLQTLLEKRLVSGDSEAIVLSQATWREERTQDRVLPGWAGTQTDLGSALTTLGERESETARLEEAVSSYRAALEELTRDRVPLDWAIAQANLGNALARLGERESGTARLEAAVSSYRAALEELTRDRVPLDWAVAQANLGNALARLGERESGTARLEEAASSYRAALEELTRDRVPLDWAMTQNNLGKVVATLSKRKRAA